MKKVRNSIIFLLFPALCFAHGEEIIHVLFAEFLVLILIVVGIFYLNHNWKKKLILTVILFFTYFLSFFLINAIPYRNHEIVIFICQFSFIIASISFVYFQFLKEK